MSDQRAREKEYTLQNIEEIQHILLDKSPDPIFAFSREERYLYVNLAFAQGVGKPVDQIIGHSIWEVFDPDEAAFRVGALRQVFRGSKGTFFLLPFLLFATMEKKTKAVINNIKTSKRTE